MAQLDRIGIGTYKLLDDTCIDIVSLALQMGYRTIDTATRYRNHTQVARGISRSGINRSEIFLTSKIHDSAQKQNRVAAEIDQILHDLCVDKIDMLLLHAPIESKISQSWRVLEEARQAGKVQHIGVSNFEICDLRQLAFAPYVNQFEIHPLNTRCKLVNYCHDNGILIQAYASLTHGIRLNDPQILDACADRKPANVLLKWAMQKDYYVIPKTANYEHLVENWSVPKTTDLSDDMIKKLDGLNEQYYTIGRYKRFDY